MTVSQALEHALFVELVLNRGWQSEPSGEGLHLRRKTTVVHVLPAPAAHRMDAAALLEPFASSPPSAVVWVWSETDDAAWDTLLGLVWPRPPLSWVTHRGAFSAVIDTDAKTLKVPRQAELPDVGDAVNAWREGSVAVDLGAAAAAPWARPMALFVRQAVRDQATRISFQGPDQQVDVAFEVNGEYRQVATQAPLRVETWLQAATWNGTIGTRNPAETWRVERTGDVVYLSR